MLEKINLFLELSCAKETFAFIISEIHNEPKNKLFHIFSNVLNRYRDDIYFIEKYINNSKKIHLIKFKI